MASATRHSEGQVIFEEPGFARWLFSSPQASVIWLIARLYLGYEWLHAGWHKITGTEGGFWDWQWAYTQNSWLKSSAGLKGFVAYSLQGANQGPNSSVNYGWYAAFLRWLENPGPVSFFSKVVAIGELVIGLMLILGLFTGIAAFLAGVLTLSFGLSGVAGVNPIFFVLEALLILAWRNAGYIGLDRWVLPAVGTPWHRGRMFDRDEGRPEPYEERREAA